MLGHNLRTMDHGIPGTLKPAVPARLEAIAGARRMLSGDPGWSGEGLIEPWIARSWQRCLAMGYEARRQLTFDQLPVAAMRSARDSNQALTQAAAPVLQQLGRALAATRYFAILTNAQGVVVDVHGPIDRHDRRAALITRIGADLSERSVGTTAIGAALAELQPVWLHRGEHFFDDTSCYSCAGAPLFGPLGECVGMLDLTGVDAPERPELKHLVTQSARGIENALVLRQPHALLLRLNWPGRHLGDDTDGLIGLDRDGFVRTSNTAARQMVPQLGGAVPARAGGMHASELFAMAFETLFDATRVEPAVMEVPLWSGLRLHALALPADCPDGGLTTLPPTRRAPPPVPDQRRLKDIEAALIRTAVDDAKGNVAQAAARLGVSRATVYRKLGSTRD